MPRNPLQINPVIEELSIRLRTASCSEHSETETRRVLQAARLWFEGPAPTAVDTGFWLGVLRLLARACELNGTREAIETELAAWRERVRTGAFPQED